MTAPCYASGRIVPRLSCSILAMGRDSSGFCPAARTDSRTLLESFAEHSSTSIVPAYRSRARISESSLRVYEALSRTLRHNFTLMRSWIPLILATPQGGEAGGPFRVRRQPAVSALGLAILLSLQIWKIPGFARRRSQPAADLHGWQRSAALDLICQALSNTRYKSAPIS
jgi:hypothetical protein